MNRYDCFPTAPVIVRDIVEDIKLGGIFIPAGTIGIIPIYAIHRHHSYWEDPDRFDPDRFSPEHPKPSRYQFMPFGAGPRICIGAAFAMIEATIMLATFIRAAHFELASGFLSRPLCPDVPFAKKRNAHVHNNAGRNG